MHILVFHIGRLHFLQFI